MDFVDLTGVRGGAGKRPASTIAEAPDGRHQKRAKDGALEEQLQPLTVTAAVPSRMKRSLEDRDDLATHDKIQAGDAVDMPDSGGSRRGNAVGRPDGNRVLQSSDLENSVASISGALRWRSPVKPYKLPRLHGTRLPGAPTAVRGIVDVGTDADNDEEPAAQQQHAAAHQQRPSAGGAGCQQQQQKSGAASGGRGEPGRGEHGQPPAPAAQAKQQQQQQPEWGRLFSALSLGGSARGSQRTDPVWAAANSNRGTGGGGSSGMARSWAATVPGLRALFRPLPGAPEPRHSLARPPMRRSAPTSTPQATAGKAAPCGPQGAPSSRPEPPPASGVGDSLGAATAAYGSGAAAPGGVAARRVEAVPVPSPGSPAPQAQGPGPRMQPIAPRPHPMQPPHHNQDHQHHQYDQYHQEKQQHHPRYGQHAAPTARQLPEQHRRQQDEPVYPQPQPQPCAAPGSHPDGRAGGAPRLAPPPPAPSRPSTASRLAPQPSRQPTAAARAHPEEPGIGLSRAASAAAGGPIIAAAAASTAAAATKGGAGGGAAAFGPPAAGSDGAQAAWQSEQRPPTQPQQPQQKPLVYERLQATHQGAKASQQTQKPPQQEQQQQRSQPAGPTASPARGAGRGRRAGSGGRGRGGSAGGVSGGNGGTGAASGARALRGRGRGGNSSPPAVAPSQLAAPTVAPAMARDACCPICGAPFLARMSNMEVNAHVDACVMRLAGS